VTKPVVLLLNHREQACGVWQYGRRLARILRASTRYAFEYAEVDSRTEWTAALARTDLAAVIYNYTDLTLPWLDLAVVHDRPAVTHLALYHEGTLPWGITAAAGQPKRLPANAWLLVTDSTHVDTTDALAVPRPLLDPVAPHPDPSVPIISSFGFGLPQKGFAHLVERVNAEFDRAIIWLHITTSAVCDAAGHQANAVIQACRSIQRKRGIELQVTTHLVSDAELMTWLANSSLCAFLYEDPGRWRGLSSVIDYALSTRVPIAVTRTPMFRHITTAEPSICVEDRSLRAILASGAAPLDRFRAQWSHEATVQRYDQILTTCLARAAGLGVSRAPAPVNCFLKSRAEIDTCTTALEAAGAPTNTACPPKNWDLWGALQHVRGRVLDLGSGTDGSFFLRACAALGLGTERWGIDIDRSPAVDGAQIIVGDLTRTPFRDGYFQTLVSLSVIEHGVADEAFAAECARLLLPGGRLVVSFDAWEPKIDTAHLPIYGLPWRIFARRDIEALVGALAERGLTLTTPIDWTLGDAVIRPGHFSPFPDVAYTFGLLVFEKQS
jgi:SAM-dependent methyltransferase